MTPNTRDRELREALAQAITISIVALPNGGGLTWNQAQAVGIDAARAALNAVPPEPLDGLDVERLARAMTAVWSADPGYYGQTAVAKAVAAEYARLAALPGTDR